MATTKTAAKGTRKPVPCRSGSAEVDDFMSALDHPLKAELQAMRLVIRDAKPGIEEGIKWNSPSFRSGSFFFATINLRASVVQVILHQDAKATAASKTGLGIDDPCRLLEWLGKERASAKFADMAAIEANTAAFRDIVRQWVDLLSKQT